MVSFKWYELDEIDKQEYYNKVTLNDFFNWWCDDDNDNVMELRMDNKDIAIECSKKFFVPCNMTSVYVNSGMLLEKIVMYARDKTNIWFGVNPKRKLKTKYGKLKYSGKDVNISQLGFLFIDIDRIIKQGVATKQDLFNANFLADKLISEFDKEKFSESYIKICSGNGIQLIFKLDVPFKLPLPMYHDTGQVYIEDDKFINIKNKIKLGVSKMLINFGSKFKEYNVEIDKTCFNLGRVAALPLTYNFKNDTKIMRGVIELKNGINDGLSDYINQMYNDINVRTKTRYKFNKFDVNSITTEHNILKTNIDSNKLINLMLNYKFPNGGINNTLWYAIKILLHYNKICNTDIEYINLHSTLKSLHNRGFTDNGLEPQYKGDYTGTIKQGDVNTVPFMVNKYLRCNKIQCIKTGKVGYHKPLFPIFPTGKIKHDITIIVTPKLFSQYTQLTDSMNVYGSDINDDNIDPLISIKKLVKNLNSIRRAELLPNHMITSTKPLTITDIGKVIITGQLNKEYKDFMVWYKHTWGNEITAYMMKYYVDDYINYKPI